MVDFFVLFFLVRHILVYYNIPFWSKGKKDSCINICKGAFKALVFLCQEKCNFISP